ncbi:MAG: NADH-quinone oxidoreductase subunit J [Bacteroidetes bacterium]|nr:NADH-quinone oxidoreductase subunit J [Bacteroidota bacterium]
MDISVIIFYIISVVITGGALLAVTSKQIFRAAVYLIFSLLGVASMYFYLENNFIAAVQIVVYVGGIVVLIIFSIFLTQNSGHRLKKPDGKRVFFSALSVLSALLLTLNVIGNYNFKSNSNNTIEPEIKNIGMQMLSTTQYGYLLPFEVVSFLLLAAMIGCIVIALKRN